MCTSILLSRVWFINFTVCLIKYNICFSYILIAFHIYLFADLTILKYHNDLFSFFLDRIHRALLKVRSGNESHAKLDEAAYSLPCLSS